MYKKIILLDIEKKDRPTNTGTLNEKDIKALSQEVIKLTSYEETNFDRDIEYILRKNFKSVYDKKELKTFINDVRKSIKLEILAQKENIVDIIFNKKDIEREVLKKFKGLEMDLNKSYFAKGMFRGTISLAMVTQIPVLIKDLLASINNISGLWAIAKDSLPLLFLAWLIINTADKFYNAYHFHERLSQELPSLMKKYTRKTNFEALLETLDKSFNGPTRYKFKRRMQIFLNKAKILYIRIYTHQLKHINILIDRFDKGKLSYPFFQVQIKIKYPRFSKLCNEEIAGKENSAEKNEHQKYYKLDDHDLLNNVSKTKLVKKLRKIMEFYTEENDDNKEHIPELIDALNLSIDPDRNKYGPWKRFVAASNKLIGAQIESLDKK